MYDYTLVCEEYVKKFKEIKEMCTENSLKIGIDKKDNEEVEVNNKVNKGNDVNEDKKQNSLNSDSKLPTFSQTSTKALFDSNLMKKLDDSDNSTAKESESEKSASLFSFGSSTFTKKLNTEFKFNDFNKNISNACSFPLKNMFPLNKNTESLAEPGKEENEDKSGETEEEVPPKTESIEHKESDSLYTKKYDFIIHLTRSLIFSNIFNLNNETDANYSTRRIIILWKKVSDIYILSVLTRNEDNC